jgi:hypothetical protein
VRRQDNQCQGAISYPASVSGSNLCRHATIVGATGELPYKGKKVGILLMEDRLHFNNIIVCLYGITESIRPKSILSTH